MSTKSSEIRRLQALPGELLQHIVEYLDGDGLSRFSLAARWCYESAASVQWREVTLTDCAREHTGLAHHEILADTRDDDHDDTPLLKKLIVLATYVTQPGTRLKVS